MRKGTDERIVAVLFTAAGVTWGLVILCLLKYLFFG